MGYNNYIFLLPITNFSLFIIIGKVFKPKEASDDQTKEEAADETEWDDVLKQATEEELVDLAGKIIITRVYYL